MQKLFENWRKYITEADTDNDGIEDERELAIIDKGELGPSGGETRIDHHGYEVDATQLKHIEVKNHPKDPKFKYGEAFLNDDILPNILGIDNREFVRMEDDELIIAVQRKLDDHLLYPSHIMDADDPGADEMYFTPKSGPGYARAPDGIYLIFEPVTDPAMEDPEYFINSLKIDDNRLDKFLSGQPVQLSESKMKH